MSDNNDVSLLGKIAQYTEILAKDPQSTVFVPLAETYRKMGFLDDALEIAEKGIAALPMYSPGYTALGRVHAQRGAFQDAAAAFAKAIDRDKESLAAIKGLAQVRVKSEDKEAARELLEKVLSLKPDDEMAKKMLVSLGGRSQVNGKSASAVTGEEPAETIRGKEEEGPLGPGGPISTPTIAELYIRQGFPQRAMKVYRDLLKEDPHNETIRRRLIELKRQIDAGEIQNGDESVVEPASKAGEDSAVETAAEPAVEPEDPVVEPVEEPDAERVRDRGEESPRTASATPAGVGADSETVSVFEKWIEAIHRRREDVQ
jgi:tetratricopeptide (TPR) repeat protein